ncbi:MAG: T9SS type A sorting domain-containing protein, partial [Bacteroidota bacterium]
YFNYPAALSSGSPVSVSQSFLAGGATGYGFYRNFLLGSTYGTSQYGNWPGETDKFLGVRFVADANAVTKRMTTHFGWVRLDVDAGNRTATVKDFAYAVTPLDPLNTQVILPVELTSFDVSVVDGTPRLAWTTATEDDNAGFEVQARRLDQPDFRTLGFVNGAGTTSEAQSYSFDATDLTPGRYAFRLRQVDFDGAFEFSPVVEATVTVPGTHLLTEAYPNPFNPSARFELSVPTQQEVRVSLHDAQGREVQELFAGRLDADSPQTIRINAVDLPSGVYLYRVVGANFTDAKTVSLVK